MKSGLWWFSRPGAVDVGRMIHDLNSRGLAYRQPGSASGTIQVVNEEGDSSHALLDQAIRYLGEDPRATAILWLDASTDVVFGPLTAMHRFVFYLDGLDWAEAQRVVFSVVACALGSEGTLGVVADRYLPDTYEAWIDCIEKGGEIPYEPDLLLLTSTAGNHNHTLILSDRSWLTNPPRPTPEVPNP